MADIRVSVMNSSTVLTDSDVQAAVPALVVAGLRRGWFRHTTHSIPSADFGDGAIIDHRRGGRRRLRRLAAGG